MSKRVNWTEIKSRLAALQARIESSWAPSAEQKRKILEARGKQLAVESEIGKRDTAALFVVEFLLAYEKYGIATSYVREVYPVQELTPIPCTPRFVLGVVNVRGQIVSVMDIKKFFDLPEPGLTDLNKLVIVNFGGVEAGVLADTLIGVRPVRPEDIQPPLATHTGIRADYLHGLTADGLAILNIEALLSDPRLTVNERPAAAGNGVE